MKQPANRTPLARLRQKIDLGQKQMADLLEWRINTYKKIERATLNMTPARALQVQMATGVSADYVSSGDLTTPMLDCWGKRYTRSTYERVKAEAKRPKVGHFDLWRLYCVTAISTARVWAILLHASRMNNAERCFLDLSKHLEKFEKQYPQDRKLYATMSKSPLVQLGKLLGSMRELCFRFEQEVTHQSLRENHKLLAELGPAEKARTKAALKKLMGKKA